MLTVEQALRLEIIDRNIECLLKQHRVTIEVTDCVENFCAGVKNGPASYGKTFLEAIGNYVLRHGDTLGVVVKRKKLKSNT